MKAQVVSNHCITGPFYKLVFNAFHNIAYIPGQFIMIRPWGDIPSSIFLPRPFSIHSVINDSHIEILYKVVGKGTEFLSKLEIGSDIGFLGPFGNGFQIDEGELPDEFLIVAGGIGVAPFVSFAELIRASHPEFPVRVFLGGRGVSDLLCVNELGKYASEIVVSTQDGSMGVRGYVTDALEGYLQRLDSKRKCTIYACGPNPMMENIYKTVSPMNIKTFFSLEANMACGMGLCMGCAVRKRDGGYYLVCKDGPVFSGDAIEFSDET